MSVTFITTVSLGEVGQLYETLLLRYSASHKSKRTGNSINVKNML